MGSYNKIIPYILSALLLLYSPIYPTINSYAQSEINYETTNDIVYDMASYADEVSEKEFLNGIKKRQEYIYISKMNEENRWLLLRSLFFKHFKDEFMQGIYLEKIDGASMIKIAYEINLRTNVTKYYIKVNREFYSRLNNPNYSDEFHRHINQLTVNAGITDNMTDKQKVERMVLYLCNTYRYDDISYHDYICTSNKPYWKIVSDYGVTVCLSDSMLLKSCLNSIGIECRIMCNDTHAWNQVKINGEWKAIDIVGYRDYRRYYMYFDDSYREIHYFLN